MTDKDFDPTIGVRTSVAMSFAHSGCEAFMETIQCPDYKYDQTTDHTCRAFQDMVLSEMQSLVRHGLLSMAVHIMDLRELENINEPAGVALEPPYLKIVQPSGATNA